MLFVPGSTKQKKINTKYKKNFWDPQKFDNAIKTDHYYRLYFYYV